METIKRFLIVNVVTTILVYLIVSFVTWDILWVKELDSFTTRKRFAMIMLWGCKIGFDCFISDLDLVKEILTHKNK